MKLFYSIFAALLLTSCATKVGIIFDPQQKDIVPEDTVFYSFPNSPEKKIYHELMHPSGSTTPEVVVYSKGIHIAFWKRPAEENQEKVFALWTTGKPVRTQLKTTGNICGAYDADGKSVRLELSGNKIYTELNNRLFYIVGTPDLEIEIPR